MVIKMTIQNMPEVIAFIESKKLNVNKEMKRAMTKVGNHMQNEVKMSISGHRAEHVSVDTGRFLNSIESEPEPLKVKIYSKVGYADFLEFGTSKFPARRHFNNSLDRNKEKVKEIISEQINNI